MVIGLATGEQDNEPRDLRVLILRDYGPAWYQHADKYVRPEMVPTLQRFAVDDQVVAGGPPPVTARDRITWPATPSSIK